VRNSQISDFRTQKAGEISPKVCAKLANFRFSHMRGSRSMAGVWFTGGCCIAGEEQRRRVGTEFRVQAPAGERIIPYSLLTQTGLSVNFFENSLHISLAIWVEMWHISASLH